ncbi:Stk1 family PASTA domain-containing Ser/Thr kinase [Saccharothrix luteola]|uniref:Stk1 family PASTA domain-containing Ser/Thr kinase n=1 Tax=Saccharothrix luteola TaxID=2893018 RepID=UPI001E6072FD|nr:Stk1 family PASTA domain-containing Ser/Thr kinase [Saccharothrix luteola]MCC8244706.1 PASTA domain-containing protein [Saccharothrix luteola]
MERSATNVIGGLLEQRYRVGALVARGGMSTVYRGVDTRLERTVAIKVMDPRFSADPQFVARFEREARAAAKLHHPGVVQVHDQGVDEDRVYLVMELVDGGTLRDLLTARGRLDVPLALTVIEKILSPLAAAHRADLVHRDVKPENVLIGPGGTVKVADFGLVRAVSTVGVTSDTMILGTVAYLSPEQVTTGTTDARSDVYSAGVLLYEMLTGAPPYVGDNAISVAYRHVNDEVPPVPDVPAEVAELVRRATRKEPFLRPADAESFLSEVETARAKLGIAAVDVPVPVAATAAEEATEHVPAPVSPAEQTLRVEPVRVGAGAPFAEPTVPVRRPNPLVPPAGGPQGTRAISRAELLAPPEPKPVGPTPPARPRPKRPPKKKTPEQLYEEMRARGKRQFITWLSVVVVAAILIGVTVWWLAIGRVATVPNLVGQDETVATALLDEASLKKTVRRENSDTVPSGQVISTDPPAGTKANQGDLVRLVVSAGKPVVPQVNGGVEVAAAEREITSVGLKAQLDPAEDEFSDRVPKGKVVTLKPAPGTPVPIGSTVTIVLSKGSEPKPVPSVTGKTKDEAFAELSAAGFEPVEGPTEFSDKVDGGKVIRTDPPAGTNMPPGNRRVTVVLSADTVTVPQVEGKTVKEAKKILEEAGLKVDVQFNDRDRARVVNQSVRAGERVPKDTRITIIAV